ncbi:MAG TPA: cobalamin biosynthesis protein CobW [Fibrobacteria bacterium]|nr:cobalamin biosynthesis protein CobW [Fibrobacteria bacterium]
MPKKIPVTIVTGFLGAGKTTLLQNLLRNAEGRRIAVVINEFGEMGIDGELLRGSGCDCPDEDIIELSNGCVCCTVQEEFLPAMLKLMERKENLDHIVIETSGLALPKPLLKAFNWPDLKSQITVDAVVTVVDAVGMATGEICDREKVKAQRAADGPLDHETPIEELFEDQLNCADLVVMSKKDLLPLDEFMQVRERIGKSLRRPVKIIDADKGMVPLDILLGIKAAAESDLDSRHSHHEEDHPEGTEHEHDEEVDSIVVKVGSVEDKEGFLAALKQLVLEHEIYRIKGFLHVPGKAMRMTLQGVGDRFETYFDRAWRHLEPRQGALVFIGRSLKGVDLERKLADKTAALSCT